MHGVPLATLLAELLVAATGCASSLEGTVVDALKRPIPNVYVTVTDETHRVLISRRPLLTSRIALQIPDAPRALTCDIVASGYLSRHITVEVVDDRADLGSVVMKVIPGLRLSSIYPGRDDSKQWLDIIVFNDSDEPAIAESLSLRASNEADATTGCLDLVTPDVVINLDDIVVSASTRNEVRTDAMIISSAGKQIKTASIAKVSMLKCSRVRLSVDTTLLYRVAPKETHKIRLALPLTARTGQAGIPIDLAAWKLKRLTLRLTDGREYSSP